MSAVRVAVIGAGVAGLQAARTLEERGLTPVVLEASDGVGGRTRTFTEDGFRIDSGAIFVMGSYEQTIAHLRKSGLSATMRRWRARTAIIDESGDPHLVRFDQPWTLLRMPQLRWSDRLRAAGRIASLVARPGVKPFDMIGLAQDDDHTTLAQWTRGVFGERSYQYVMRPLMGPLTGADPELISSAFTRALLKLPHKVQLTIPSEGMGAIADSLAVGLDVRTKCVVERIERMPDGLMLTTSNGQEVFDAAVIATDVKTAARLVEEVAPPHVAQRLRDVRPVNAHHVVFGYRNDPWPSAPYDLAVRAHAGEHHNYGVLLDGRRSPGAAPPGGQLVSVWFDRSQAPTDSADELVALATEAIAAAYGSAGEPDLVRVFSWDVALIAPEPGHYESMRAASHAMPPDVRLAGDFLIHSGIEGALLAGRTAGQQIEARPGT